MRLDGRQFRLFRASASPRGSIYGTVEATHGGTKIEAQFVANPGLIAFGALNGLAWIGFSVFVASALPFGPALRLLCLAAMIAVGVLVAVLVTWSVRSEDNRLSGFLRELFEEDIT